MAKLTREEYVALPVLEKICAELECNIGDIMEFNNLEKIRKRKHGGIKYGFICRFVRKTKERQ